MICCLGKRPLKKKLANLALAAGTAIFFAPEPAAANDWEGLSIGAGGGYGMAKNKFGTSFATGGLGIGTSQELGGAGGFGTVSAGYDHSLLGVLVVGAFADYDFGDIGTDFSGINFKIGNQLSLGGRIGYLVAPTTLFFTTFGYAHADASDITASGFGTIARVGDYDGYFIGNGVETLIGNGFSLKAEYRYTSMQAADARFVIDPTDTLKGSIKPQIQTARLSLNYRFGNGKTEPVDNSIPPVTSTWTAFYLGVGAGMAIANTKAPDLIGGGTGKSGADGGFLSFTAGYDYQLNKRFVIGAFADADYTTLEDHESLNQSIAGSSLSLDIRNKFRDILMVGGRFGYLTTPDTMFFASGGYANAGLGDTTATISGSCACGGPSGVILSGKRFSGGFVGGGVETRINDALSLKAEYRYIDFSSERMTIADGIFGPVPSDVSIKFDPDIQMGRVSINWRFNGSRAPGETTTGPLD